MNRDQFVTNRDSLSPLVKESEHGQAVLTSRHSRQGYGPHPGSNHNGGSLFPSDCEFLFPSKPFHSVRRKAQVVRSSTLHPHPTPYSLHTTFYPLHLAPCALRLPLVPFTPYALRGHISHWGIFLHALFATWTRRAWYSLNSFSSGGRCLMKSFWTSS